MELDTKIGECKLVSSLYYRKQKKKVRIEALEKRTQVKDSYLRVHSLVKRIHK